MPKIRWCSHCALEREFIRVGWASESGKKEIREVYNCKICCGELVIYTPKEEFDYKEKRNV